MNPTHRLISTLLVALAATSCAHSGPRPVYSAPPPVYAEPSDLPPAPPRYIPGPQGGVAAFEPGYGTPEGQWVQTDAYGWVFMPYGQPYTYVPASGTPYEYVFGRTFGWRWVAAGWVYGEGPAPRWGPRGVERFVWYSRPWFPRRHVYVEPARPMPAERRYEERQEVRQEERREERRDERQEVRHEVRQEERREERHDARQEERKEEHHADQRKARPPPPMDDKGKPHPVHDGKDDHQSDHDHEHDRDH